MSDGDGKRRTRRANINDPLVEVQEILRRIDADETTVAAETGRLTELLAELEHAQADATPVAGPPHRSGSGAEEIFARIDRGRATVLAQSETRRQATLTTAEQVHLETRGRHSRRRQLIGQIAISGAILLIVAALPAGYFLVRSVIDGPGTAAPIPTVSTTDEDLAAIDEPSPAAPENPLPEPERAVRDAPLVEPAAVEGPLADLQARAEGGDVRALYDLGLHYLRGDQVDQSHVQAARWLEAAADAGLAEAQYNIGVLYDQGLGVDQDDITATSWFSDAAEQGYAKAQYALGVAYARAKGVPEDADMAAEWFEFAAAQGLAEAMFALAVFSEQGIAGPVDLAVALDWYRLAEEYGIPTAGAKVTDIERRLAAP